MSVTVNFYNFSKKRNSTKRPTGTALASVDCLLKEPSGVISPELFLTVGNSVPASANYAYIADFNRYYFIKEWTYTRGGWLASLSVDVLATYKTQIGSSTQYVRRAQSAYNTNVIDDVIPTKPVPKAKSSVFCASGTLPVYSLGDPFPAHTITSGRYVVGVINSDSNAVGSSSYYVMDDTQFKLFKAVMMDITHYSLDEAEQDLLRAQFNPISYISSVRWFPCEIARENTYSNNIPFGWWNLSGSYHAFRITGAPTVAQGYIMNYAIATEDGYSTGIPYNSQSLIKYPSTSDPRHSNVDGDKYCKYQLVAQPFGIFPVPADVVAAAASINIEISVDPMSGMGSMRAYAVPASNTNQKIELAKSTTKIAIDIPMAQIARDNLAITSSSIDAAAGVTSGILGIATGGVFGGDPVAGLASAAKAGINMVASSVPQVRSSGAMGSMAEYFLDTKPYLKGLFYDLEEEAPAVMGYPLAKNRQISSLSGFIMCGNVELDLPATESEQDEVISLMQGGFEYE